MKSTDIETVENCSKNPKHWKLKGLFYFNKENKRIIVDKRNPKYGTTLNFAHAKSYLILLIALLFFGFIVFVIMKKAS
jgi:uncharacterized membrane protein